MSFPFKCPKNAKVFETDAFPLTDHQGTVTTPDGRKVLKAIPTELSDDLIADIKKEVSDFLEYFNSFDQQHSFFDT